MRPVLEEGDAELVSRSRAGNREAFGRIVARYQSLICSVAYSATGNLAQSEELAQETFLTAWKQLHNLREPQRLRAWLCGIARNLVHAAFRVESRQPTHEAQGLETIQNEPGAELPPSEQAIHREEEVILWRALERLPEPYREPLILFYREHQSVERVAEALDLSPDAVKQRLTRGRRMLQAEVVAFVERALERTKPGNAFTLGVVAALPIFAATSGAAATLAGGASKAGLAFKGAAVAGLTGAVLGPVIGILGGVWGAWCSIKNTRSARERRFMIRCSWIVSVYAGLFIVAFSALMYLGRRMVKHDPWLFGSALAVLVVGYAAGLLTLILWGNRRQHQIRIADGTVDPPASLPPRVPSRAQQLRAVYGSLGGSTVGVLGWMVGQAIQTREWITLAATVYFGVAVVHIGSRAMLRKPERRWRIILQAVGLLGLYVAGVGLVNWRAWTRDAGVEVSGSEAVLVGAGLTTVVILVGLINFFLHSPPRPPANR